MAAASLAKHFTWPRALCERFTVTLIPPVVDVPLDNPAPGEGHATPPRFQGRL